MADGTITIDGQTVPFTEGQTIMQAAEAAGVYIAHLCHHPEFRPHGSCKLCTVKAGGRHVAACTVPASDGLEVENESEELAAGRRALLQLLFVEGNHYCPFCERSGNCQLQALAYRYGMVEPHFPHFYPQREVDASHPDVVLERNRCILCALCVRASRDVDGKHVFDIVGRGIHARLAVNSASGRLADTDLAPGDRALEVCPVGAIIVRGRGFAVPIGERLYDHRPINEIGNRVPESEQ